MIRFTWLQARVQTFVAVGALAVIAVMLAVTGSRIVDLYNTTVARCQLQGDCDSARHALLNTDGAIRNGLGFALVCVPALIGMFWGAPLVAREFEAGTFRLGWTQGVTRSRWLAGKLGVVGLLSMATAGLLSLMLTWWASPLDRANMNAFGSFDQRDIVPIGYAAFAFVLGVTAGIAFRRTVPAMAATLVAFVAVRIAVTSWLRPLLIAPLHRSLPLDPASTGYGSSVSGLSAFGIIFHGPPKSALQPAAPTMPNAWIYSTRIVDAGGHGLSTTVLNADCPTIGNHAGPGPTGGAGTSHSEVTASAQQALHDCVTKVGATYHQLVTYQPGGRYWAFQWCEMAVFLATAAILGAVCFWAIRRRLS
jgi:hypothetical protein